MSALVFLIYINDDPGTEENLNAEIIECADDVCLHLEFRRNHKWARLENSTEMVSKWADCNGLELKRNHSNYMNVRMPSVRDSRVIKIHS